MGHCLITLYEHTGDEKYLDIAKSKVEYLEKEALRFGDHVLQHTVSVNNDFPEQAWADTLFMAAFFLLRMGVLLKDAALIGLPMQVVVGGKGLARGIVEVKNRKTGEKGELPVEGFAEAFAEWRKGVLACWGM